jgi:lipopolysaccharide export LptBFGC system permease protein LptF
MFLSYARHTFLVTCGILVIALSIDLTFYLSKVLVTAAESQNVWPALFLVWYLGLRSVDFLAELLPLAGFFGVFWAEIVHTISNERLVVWLSGRAAYQCLTPVLLFGAVLGFVELGLNLYIRPAAVTAQIEARLGSYGERFDRRPRSESRWVAAGQDLMQANIVPGPPPELRDVRIYRMNQDLSLQFYYRARSANPIDDHSWMLVDGRKWTMQAPDDALAAGSSDSEFFDAKKGTQFERERIDLEIAPLWVSNYRTAPRYLPFDVFGALSKLNFSPKSYFWTWSYARFSLSIFAAVMPLLAASLSMLLLVSEIRLVPLVVIAIVGYFANTTMKVFVVLGEHDYVSPAIAALLPPFLLLLACATVSFIKK